MSDTESFTVPSDPTPTSSTTDQETAPAQQKTEPGPAKSKRGASKAKGAAGKPASKSRETAPAQQKTEPSPKHVAMEETVHADVKRTRVRFLESSGPGGSDRVVLCVDGINYAYARNVDVDVPDHVLAAADDAAPAEMDPSTGRMRRVPSYPYQIVR